VGKWLLQLLLQEGSEEGKNKEGFLVLQDICPKNWEGFEKMTQRRGLAHNHCKDGKTTEDRLTKNSEKPKLPMRWDWMEESKSESPSL